MSLVNKTNSYFLAFLGLLFPLAVALDYYLIKHLVDSEVEKILIHESERINSHLASEKTLPSSSFIFEIKPAETMSGLSGNFKDTLMFEAYAKRSVSYRTFQFNTSVDAQPVSITLRHTLLEMEELVLLLLAATAFILFLLTTGLFFINQKIYRKIWNPFFQNLSKLKEYNVLKEESVNLKASRISEFEELNAILSSLISRVKKDFQNLKEFNENISHEIQTPLAIIRNKVVLLLESKNLDEKELQRVEAIYQETNKLSKIGKSLTLISRIENQEFKRLDRVDVSAIIKNTLSNMEEMINFKKLEIKATLAPVTVECDHILADILFTNLIKNAVQHNVEGGSIQIALDQERFSISNTGDAPTVPADKLFHRFQRGTSARESLGLGLAINQKICDIYGFRLTYTIEKDRHTFNLFFKA